MKNKRGMLALFALITMTIFLSIGATIAYYQTSDTYTNEFSTGKYIIKTQETFESPDNWVPGDITPKTISVKNEGTVDAAVKVCLSEKWEDKDGNELPLEDSERRRAAKLNFNYDTFIRWTIGCEALTSEKYCLYYYKKLKPGETTENLLESVTFNPEFNIENSTTCTTDPVTHIESCTTVPNGYAGGKYTLYLDIETVQYSEYQNVFGDIQVFSEDTLNCKDYEIMDELPDTTGKVTYFIGRDVYLKDSELDDYDLSNANCEVVYANSYSEENKYNKCRGAIYIVSTNSQPGDTITINPISIRGFSYQELEEQNEQDGPVKIMVGATAQTYNQIRVAYAKPSININYYTYNDNDITEMNFSDMVSNHWNNSGYVVLRASSSSTFIMPDHGVIFEVSTPRTAVYN